MHDTETDEACAHISVDYEPYQCDDGGLHESWKCRDCPAEFVPADWVEMPDEARDEMGRLYVENAKQRFALVVAGAVILGMLVGRR